MPETPKRLVRLATAALLTTILCVSGLPTLSTAFEDGDPGYILDAAGDTSPAGDLFADPAAAALAQADVNAYDLRTFAFVAETNDAFTLEFRVADLPRAWSADDLSGGTAPSQPTITLLAEFQIASTPYQVLVDLAQVGDTVSKSFKLHPASGPDVDLQGAIDTSRNTAQVLVPKALVGDPPRGAAVERIRTEARFNGVPLDWAPDTQDITSEAQADPSIVVVIVKKVLAGGGVESVRAEYAFAPDYVFQFPRPSNVGADVRLTAQPNALTIQAGGAATYAVAVKNAGSSSDTVYFQLSKAATGWGHSVSPTTLALLPGQEKAVAVKVSSASGAHGYFDSYLSATSVRGQSDLLALRTTVGGVAGGGGGSAGGEPSASDGSGDPNVPATHVPAKHRSPGPEASLAAVAVLGVLLLVRRRT